MLDIPTIAIIAFIVLLGSFLYGLTGFGFSLTTSPILLLLFANPKEVVVLNVALSFFIGLLIVSQARRLIQLARVWPLLLPALPGLVLGTYVIKAISPSTLKIGIAILCIIFAIPLLLGFAHKVKRERLGLNLAGFSSGLLASSTSLAGPPTVLFAVNQGWPKDVLRANINGFFLPLTTLTLVSLWLSGLVNGSTLTLALSLAPVALLGFSLGLLTLPHLKSELFRRVAVAIIISSALAALTLELNPLGWGR